MKDIYEKVGYIIQSLLMYDYRVRTISKPIFDIDKAELAITDLNGTTRYLELPYNSLVKMHSYKLENYIVSIMENL